MYDFQIEINLKSQNLKGRRQNDTEETWRERRFRYCTNLSLLGGCWLAGSLPCLSVVRSLLPVVLRPGCTVVWLASGRGCCSPCCSRDCSCCPRDGATCLGWRWQTEEAWPSSQQSSLSNGCRAKTNKQLFPWQLNCPTSILLTSSNQVFSSSVMWQVATWSILKPNSVLIVCILLCVLCCIAAEPKAFWATTERNPKIISVLKKNQKEEAKTYYMAGPPFICFHLPYSLFTHIN